MTLGRYPLSILVAADHQLCQPCQLPQLRTQPAFRVQGAGCRVQGAGFRVQGVGFRVQGSGCRVRDQGSWFMVHGSGCRVLGPPDPLPHQSTRRRSHHTVWASKAISTRNLVDTSVNDMSFHRTIHTTGEPTCEKTHPPRTLP